MSTSIQWTDETWNPVVGCTQVSAGCDHCYAKTLHDMRHKAVLTGKQLAAQYAEPFETVQLKPERLPQPLSWQKARRVFVNSVSDLFHADVPDQYLDKVFAVMALARRHTFQILTKRAGRMRSYLADPATYARVRRELEEGEVSSLRWARMTRHERERKAMQWYTDLSPNDWPLQNVWLGVSVENAAALPRIHALRETKAAVRFVSFEPLLEGVEPNLDAIDWAIIGGESGKGARRFNIEWAYSLIKRCRASGTKPFMKQLGRFPVGLDTDCDACDMGLDVPRRSHGLDCVGHALHDSHGGDMSEWPADLQVREFPVSAVPSHD